MFSRLRIYQYNKDDFRFKFLFFKRQGYIIHINMETKRETVKLQLLFLPLELEMVIFVNAIFEEPDIE